MFAKVCKYTKGMLVNRSVFTQMMELPCNRVTDVKKCIKLQNCTLKDILIEIAALTLLRSLRMIIGRGRSMT